MTGLINAIFAFQSLSFRFPELWAIVIVVLMAAFGVALPYLAARVLAAKQAERVAFFERRLGEYRDFVAREGHGPRMSKGAERFEADLARWARSVEKQASALRLEKQQVRALSDSGVLAFAPDRVAYIEERSRPDGSDEREYTLVPRPWMSVAGCLLMALSAFLVAALGANLPALVLGCALIACVAVCMACDLKAMNIPYQLSYACYPLALVFAVVARWPEWAPSIIGGIASLVLLRIVFGLANRLALWRGNTAGVSKGDMRLIPALALAGGGGGSILGFAAMAVVMFLFALAAILFRGKGLRSYLPMAPGLYVWTVVAVAVNAGMGAL